MLGVILDIGQHQPIVQLLPLLVVIIVQRLGQRNALRMVLGMRHDRPPFQATMVLHTEPCVNDPAFDAEMLRLACGRHATLLANRGKGMVVFVGAGVRAPFMTTDNIV